MADMPQTALKDYIEPYPGIRDYIFAPPAEGVSRTWIFITAEDPPQTILNYHFVSLLTHGWRVIRNEPLIVAKRADADLLVSVVSREDETRVVYEVLTPTAV